MVMGVISMSVLVTRNVAENIYDEKKVVKLAYNQRKVCILCSFFSFEA